MIDKRVLIFVGVLMGMTSYPMDFQFTAVNGYINPIVGHINHILAFIDFHEKCCGWKSHPQIRMQVLLEGISAVQHYGKGTEIPNYTIFRIIL